MSQTNGNSLDQSIKKKDKDVEGGPIRGRLSSDNAFSESGLENAERLSEAMKKGNSK